MASLTTHLAKRAIESYGSVRKAGMPPRVEAALQDIRSFETPMWFNVVSVITVVAFLVTFSLVGSPSAYFLQMVWSLTSER